MSEKKIQPAKVQAKEKREHLRGNEVGCHDGGHFPSAKLERAHHVHRKQRHGHEVRRVHQELRYQNLPH